MFLFGHIGITLGLFILLEYAVPGIRGRIDYRYVVLGALIPDIIDKLIGRIIFPYSIASGRLIAHALIFSLLFSLAAFYYFKRYGENRYLPMSGAFFLHLLEDRMWMNPEIFFWPFLGWKFHPGTPPDYWLDYFMIMAKNSFTPDFSLTFISEVLGLGIIVIYIMALVLKRKR